MAASSEALAQCYVDSEGGSDENDGLSETTPVRTQAAIPSDCTEVYFARGSVFYEALATGGGFGGPGGGGGSRTLFTNYGDPNLPLPTFVVTSGSVVSGMMGGGLTIDGLHLSGSRGDGTMENLIQGVCVTLGSDNTFINNDVDECDIGMMIMGENNLIENNVIHDLHMAVDSTDTTVYANIVGGAEGMFINASNNEVAYNFFYNCVDVAAWTGGNCDGGATEVSVPRDGEVTGVRVHHNVSYNNCGFFEVSGFGVFSDSDFYYNVMIDQGWMFLLQVNETTLQNINWTNNTQVHHASTNELITPSINMIYQAEVTPGTVFFTNNLVIFDGVNAYLATVDENITQSNNLIVTEDPGVKNLAGINPEDFDLVEGSAAIDGGKATSYARDFLNRVVPAGAAPDIGAFEYGAEQGEPLPEQPPISPASGGAGTGGAETGGTAAGGDGAGGASTGGEALGGATTGGATTGGVAAGGTSPAGGTGATDPVDTGGTDPAAPTCDPTLMLCGDLCVNIASDPAHCGNCEIACAEGEVCSGGTCQGACAEGQTQCGQACVDVRSDPMNCGFCGKVCADGEECTSGWCTRRSTGSGGSTTDPDPITITVTGGGTNDSDDSEEEPSCACSAVGRRGGDPWPLFGLALVGVALACHRRR